MLFGFSTLGVCDGDGVCDVAIVVPGFCPFAPLEPPQAEMPIARLVKIMIVRKRKASSSWFRPGRVVITVGVRCLRHPTCSPAEKRSNVVQTAQRSLLS